MADVQGPSFGEQLRRLRARAGLSQEALAERAGLTVKGIGALERGERQHPYPHTIQALIAALGLSASEQRELLAAIPRRRMPGQPADRPVAPGARPLIGRGADIAAVGQLLGQGRLVTLTGPGGVGKTSIALAVAAQLADAFADGVAIVELAALDDSALVVPTIVAALDAPAGIGEPLQAVLHRTLRDKQLLLVLDNLEHVVAAAAEIAALLAACPRLSILATSRTPLRLRDEHLFPIAPLALPGPGHEVSLEALAQVPAVALFVRAARQAAPDFALTAANAAAVAAICRRLDGLPLAIELAAARVRQLGVARLRERLDQTLQLLAGGARDLPARQQTMRHAIGWSYELLEPAERALFRRLAVFAGGWTLPAAEAILAAPDGAVLDGLGALVDHALVVAEPAGDDMRYRMLETISAFAGEQLRAADDETASRDRHAAYYAQELGERTEGLLTGAMYAHWQELAPEMENIRAAWAWAVRRRSHMDLARMGQAIQTIYELRGFFEESVARFREAVEALREASPTADSAALAWSLGQLLSLYGIRAARAGQLAEAEAWLRESLHLLELREDLQVRAGTLAWLGYVITLRGGYAEARALLQRSITLAQAQRHSFFLAFSLTYLAQVAVMQGADDALALAEAGLERWQANGHPRGTSSGLWVLSCAQLARGDLQAAEAAAQASRAASEAVQDRWAVGRALLQLGLVALARDEDAAASAWVAASLAIVRELSEPWLQGRALVALGQLAYRQGNGALARERLEAALALGRQLALPPLVLGARCGLAELLAADDPAAAHTLLSAIIADPTVEQMTLLQARQLQRRLSAGPPAAPEPERAPPAWPEASPDE